MIQRIQTVFLMIATGAFITELITPITKSSQTAPAGVYQDGLLFLNENQITMALVVLTALLTLGAIFLFKNRKLQKNTVITAIILLFIGNLATGYLFLDETQEIMSLSQAQIFPGLGAFMPLIALVALILAYRGISKDDKIVKSMDRLR